MKHIIRRIIPIVLLLGGTLTGCNNPANNETHYVRLSDAACTFRHTDNTPFTIEVITSPDNWEARSSGSWLQAERQGTALVLTPEENLTGAERSTEVTVTAGQATARIQVTQLGDTTLPIIYRKLDDLHSSAISPDGNIVGGYYSTADDESYSKMTVVFIDLRTGERTEFGPYPESLILPTSVSCVTSQGLMYVVNGQGDMFAFDMHERNYFIPEVAGYATIQVNSSSADGTKWVGRATGKGETMYVPLISENGTVRELPMTELNYRNEPHSMGIIARGISADGSIADGTIWDNLDFGMAYWDKEGNVHYVGEDVRTVTTVQRSDGYGGTYDYNIVNGMISWAGTYQASPSGKYIAGTYREESISENGETINESYWPAFFNTETKKTHVFNEFGDGCGMTATDDGIGFIGTPSVFTTAGAVVNIETGEHLGSIQEWVMDRYGLYLPAAGFVQYVIPTGEPGSEFILWGISPDSTVSEPNWYVAPNPAK